MMETYLKWKFMVKLQERVVYSLIVGEFLVRERDYFDRVIRGLFKVVGGGS